MSDAAPGESRWFDAATAVLATVLVTACTIGPLYSLRLRIAPAVTGSLIDDDTLNRWFLAVHLIVGTGAVLLMLWRHFRGVAVRTADRRLAAIGAGAAVVLIALLLWSSEWSVVENRSLTQAALFGLTTVSAVALGRVVRIPVLVAVLAFTHHVLLAWSVWTVRRHWIGAVDERGHWTGLFLNKNSLGPVAAVALLSLVCGAWLLWDHRGHVPRAIVATAAVVATGAAAVDLAILAKADSITSMAGFACAVAAPVVAMAARRWALRREKATFPAVTSALLAGWVGAVAAVAIGREVLATTLHRSATLSGRTELWGWLVPRIGDRPVGGWGWLSVWEEPSLRRQVVARFKIPFATAHNGVLEVALGAGIPAAVAVVTVMVVSLLIATRWFARTGSAAAGVGLALVVYALAVNHLETFVGANLLPWVLLLTVTTDAATRPATDGAPAVAVTD